MLNNKLLKATVKYIIVAFIYSIIIISGFYLIFNQPIKEFFKVIDLFSNKNNEKILEEVKLNIDKKDLKTYPDYGSKYGTLEIPSLKIKQDIYYGDDLSILKHGVGHYIASYFPGEGGSILYMGHNNGKMLKKLVDISIGDKIIVKTTYGEFSYSVTHTKIIKDTEINEVPIQREQEILMIYTCYPVNSIFYTPYRFVAYANIDNV